MARPKSSISTAKRLEYATGYLALGLHEDALVELSRIQRMDIHRTDVRSLRIEAFMAGRKWDQVITAASALTKDRPEEESAWIAWAYALREIQDIAKAEQVLLEAETLHGVDSGVLHYNLACYASLLGRQEMAKKRLKRALNKDKEWLRSALEDADLQALWGELKTWK